MKKYFCNPVNIDYHYQFVKGYLGTGEVHISREAADPMNSSLGFTLPCPLGQVTKFLCNTACL